MSEPKYKLGQVVEPDEDSCCDSCRFADAELKVYSYPHGHPAIKDLGPSFYHKRKEFTHEEVMILCEFCASTMASKAFEYPGLYSDERFTLSTLAYGFNLVMAKLDKICTLLELEKQILELEALRQAQEEELAELRGKKEEETDDHMAP